MPADDFFDRSEFVQYFRDETDELLQSIDGDLLRLEQFVDTGTVDAEIVASLFRALHTIKGSAGMLEFASVQQVAHKLENVFDLLRKDHMPLTELDPAPDYELICRASGGHAERVEDPGQLPDALRRARRVVREEKRQALLNVICKKP